ncbi:MAG: hypothetical protein ACREFL_21090 [Stellaceae bacterium]
MQGKEQQRQEWLDALAGLGAIRFARRYHRFREAFAFYRDLVGLPLRESFARSYGSTGAIFALPESACTFELIAAAAPVLVDPDEQLCLYFRDAAAMAAVRTRLEAAGVAPVAAHPYWTATGAVAFRNPEGRGLVLAPFLYGVNEPAAGRAEGEHAFPSAEPQRLDAPGQGQQRR